MKELIPRLIKAEKLYGGPHSEILSLCIPILSKVTDSPLPFKRLQLSIALAYYLKLNNARGQSLERAGIYLPKNIFSQCNGYSRCVNPNSVLIYAEQSKFDSRQYLMEGKTYTCNIVCPELFPR
jgi:hypothetical protein